MIDWLIEEESHQKSLFNNWKDKSIEAMQNFHNKYPFLNCEINCLLAKDEWLRNGTIQVDYQINFNLKPEYQKEFLSFMSNLLSIETYEKNESILKEITNTEKKNITLSSIFKQIDKINKEKPILGNWTLFNEYYSKYDKYSNDEDEDELDGMRILLGEYGILTNTWITILDKSRSYDIEFTLTKNQVIIADNLTENKEKTYNDTAYGLNNLVIKQNKLKI